MYSQCYISGSRSRPPTPPHSPEHFVRENVLKRESRCCSLCAQQTKNEHLFSQSQRISDEFT
ncbi:hypothetical protein J6590_008093 [Homalodisca vitripennis]|nr:hypothetical protein J6590_008093 [Homalodisca vitripennis]